ncbi:RloB family protein [Streptomyces candidus]|uniref:RloB domain-containing protein n=1 Tax=Streptomyces candidus TaxID=67283 RepID=A0A7X0HG50_9ACTN|nr:RloB family protein [Streptomyces candidus]MBB6437035.1 hypothetical protein [Streptomyces candidus]GHH32715.1 hypothetical protein GCM10018773_02190 [Streptomyces candidus]
MARTRGKEELGKKSYGAKRKAVVYVFTEGKATEPSYIDIIWQRRLADKELPAPAIDVHISNRKATGPDRKPITLVEAAERTLREETRAAKKNKTPLPEVWVLFDRDQHEHVQKAIDEGEAAGLHVAFSHPCFEVWRLLHHKPVLSTQFSGVCDEAERLLPFVQTSANIKIVQPEEIPKGSYTKARDRAHKMNAQHKPHVPRSRRDPYTDMPEFIEKGLRITTY